MNRRQVIKDFLEWQEHGDKAFDSKNQHNETVEAYLNSSRENVNKIRSTIQSNQIQLKLELLIFSTLGEKPDTRVINLIEDTRKDILLVTL